MAYQLVAEVLDHAPAGLTAAERLILVALAEVIRRGREWDYEAKHLRRRTGLDERGLRAALRRLAEHGVDVRVPIDKDRNGRPLYAKQGTVPRYRLPAFPPPPGCQCDTCEQARAGGTVVPPPNVGGTTGSAGVTTGSAGVTTGSAGVTTGSAADAVVPPTTSVPQDVDVVSAGGAAATGAAPPGSTRAIPPWCGRCNSPRARRVIDAETGAITKQPCPTCSRSRALVTST